MLLKNNEICLMFIIIKKTNREQLAQAQHGTTKLHKGIIGVCETHFAKLRRKKRFRERDEEKKGIIRAEKPCFSGCPISVCCVGRILIRDQKSEAIVLKSLGLVGLAS
jgi:hypothetical protein